MDIKMFAIGGQWRWSINATSTGDVYVGTITDTTTAHRLIDLVESRGGTAVSLHGNGISGEFTIKDARNLFYKKSAEQMLPPISELIK